MAGPQEKVTPPPSSMLPFDLLQRSEAARIALQEMKVRIWEKRAWAFWRSVGYYTRDPLQAEIFDFARAWNIARNFVTPNELHFEPIIPNDAPESDLKSRLEALLKRTEI